MIKRGKTMDIKDILSCLKGVRGHGGQYMARCPHHDDRNASLSVSVGTDGRVLLNCHAGCRTEDIVWAMGLQMKDLFAEIRSGDVFPSYGEPQKKERSPVVATYTYPHGQQKLRRADKSFTWRRPDGKGGWEWNRRGVPHELYVAGTLSGAVFVVEGEKDADSLHKLGYDAVTSEDGAGPGKWRKEYTEQLRGRSVCIFQDNDQVGKDFAQETAAALHGACTSVKVLDLSTVWPEIPEHGDVSDLIAHFGDERAAGMIAQLVATTPNWEPVPTESTPSAKPTLICAADVPYEPPRWLISPYIQKGKGTLIQGDNGAGKTAFVCAITAHVTTGQPLLGLPVTTPGDVLILSVEDDLPVLRGRIEANGGNLARCHFMANAAGLTFNSPEVEAAIKQVEAQLVIFDPFQAFMGAGVDMFRSNETRPELAKLFEMCARNDCACIIVAHTAKSAGDKSPVNRALGSVDIPAAMRSIMQLIRNPDNEDECVMVHVKCSNAPKGRSIAYTIGDRGGVQWVGFSPITADDLTAVVKRKEKGVPYDKEPLVQVFNQLITDKPGGGFWSYEDVRTIGAKLLGFPPFYSTADLKQKLSGPFVRELQEKDGLIVTCGHRAHGGVRGIKIEQYKVPQGYQTQMVTEG